MLKATLEVQRRAFLEHPYPSVTERRADLTALLAFVQDHREEIISAISADFGHRSRHETILTDIGPVVAAIKHALKSLKRWTRTQRRGVDRLAYGLASNRVTPQPLGVVGVIVPWNFPLNLSFGPLACVLAAGNRAMVKMSENSASLSRFIVERMPKYLPAQKLQFFAGAKGLGSAFAQLPFDHLMFTGSSATGRSVMSAAAQNLCPVTLELGGKSPAIVTDDFDLRTAAERILFAKYLNAGQVCTTVDYAFVPERSVESFVKLSYEIVRQRYPSLDSPDYTSVIDRKAYERLKAWLDEATQQGAQVLPLLEGPAFDDARHRMAPHLVLGAPDTGTLMTREIFGPILPLVAYKSLDQVIDYINTRPRPLALYPFSNERATQTRILERVMSGGVSINDAVLHVAQEDLPFGGVGESGMGHYHGYEGFLTFSKLRPVFHQARWSSLSVLMPPYGKLADWVLNFMTR